LGILSRCQTRPALSQLSQLQNLYFQITQAFYKVISLDTEELLSLFNSKAAAVELLFSIFINVIGKIDPISLFSSVLLN